MGSLSFSCGQGSESGFFLVANSLLEMRHSDSQTAPRMGPERSCSRVNLFEGKGSNLSRNLALSSGCSCR